MPTPNTQANKKALRTAMRQARKGQAKAPSLMHNWILRILREHIDE